MTAKNIQIRETVLDIPDHTNRLKPKTVVFVMIGLSIALFCTLIDQTIVSTSLVTIGRKLDSPSKAPWVATAYLLTSTACQPIWGRMSDVTGRKYALMSALFIFLVGTGLNSAAQTITQLIVFRAITGTGGGGVATMVMIVISDIVSLRDRGKYQGLTGTTVALSTSLGGLIGGALTVKVGWRMDFWFNLPLTVIALLIVAFLVPFKPTTGPVLAKLRKIDWVGSGMILTSTTLFLLPITWGGNEYPWNTAGTLAPLVLGISLIPLFVWWEHQVALPIIPLRLFRSTTVSSLIVITWLSGAVFYIQLFFLPMYFQEVWGVSSLRSGVLLLALVLPLTVFSFTSGAMVSWTGEYRYSMLVGFTIWTVGLGLLSTLSENSMLAKIIVYQIIVGVGAGQTFQTSLVACQASVSRQEVAVVTSLRNFARLLGGTLGLAASSALLSAGSQKLRGKRGTVRGLQNVWYFCTSCAGLCLILTATAVRRVELKRESVPAGDDVEAVQPPPLFVIGTDANVSVPESNGVINVEGVQPHAKTNTVE